MNIEIFQGGFVQYYNNKVVEKIVFKSKGVKVGTSFIRVSSDKISEFDDFEYTRTCMVHFHNKPSVELHNIKFCGAYNRQYGIPISEDGSKLFVGVWERGESGLKRGISAYDIASDSLLWRVNEGRIRQIFVYTNYLVAASVDNAIVKVDIETGEVLGKVKSGRLENMFDLGFPYVIADTLSGKLGVVDVETMSIVKNYGSPYKSKLINPSNCFSIDIQDAVLQDNALIIYGFECYPNGVGFDKPYDPYAPSTSTPFERVLDTDFFASIPKE